MQDTAFDPAAIATDAVALAELHGGTGNECTRIEWLQRRLEKAPGRQYVDGVGNLVWTPTPSSPAPGNCAPPSRKSWNFPRTRRGA
jgi:hypothetical protein